MRKELARITRHERYAMWICAVGCVVTFACYAHAFTSGPAIKLLAIDVYGEAFFAGSGDDCAAAFKGAVFPDDWRELRCVGSSSPLYAE